VSNGERTTDLLLIVWGHANPALPQWPRYDIASRAVMSFDADCRILLDPSAVRREWWTRNVYAPVMGGRFTSVT
jgi:carboxylesterase type B